MDRPIMPGLRLSLAMTANKAANDTMQLPTNSRRMASHLDRREILHFHYLKTSREFPNKMFPVAAARPSHVNEPVCYYAGVVSLLVVVHPLVALTNEALLFTEGSDDRGAQQCLIEVGVDW